MARRQYSALVGPAEAKRRERHDASVDDIMGGLDKLNAQREICDEADHFYDGDVGMVYASDHVRRLLEKQGVEEVDDFNYARIPVDVIANRLQITAVVASAAEEGEQETDDAETTTAKVDDATVEQATKLIAKLRKNNQLDIEEKRLHKDVSRHGEAFLLVWPVTDDSGKVTDVHMRVNSAHNVAMVYDEEDQLKALYVIKSWPSTQDGQTVTRANLYYEDRIERWATMPGAGPNERESWQKLVDVAEEVETEDLADVAADEFSDDEAEEDQVNLDDIANPWGMVWFHFRNDSPCGFPEHRGAYGPQQMINKAVYAIAGVIDYQGFPQRYIMVDPMQDDPMYNSNDPDHPDDEEDDPESQAGTSGLSADAGSIWRLFGKSTGQYSAADPDVFLKPLDRFIKAMAELTDTPQYAFTKATADMPSGEAIRGLNGPTNAKIKDRQDRYDPVWEDAYERALAMFGVEGVSVNVHWAPLEVVNDAAGWGVIVQKIAAGVPPKVVLEEAGYGPEQVDEWLKDATGADLGRRVAILNQIGTAVQTLGAGIALGAVSAPQVQEIIARMMDLTIAGTEIKAPEGDFVDPVKVAEEQQAAALKAQQDLAKSGQAHQKDIVTTGHEHQKQMAEEGHKRALDFAAQQQATGQPPPRRGRPNPAGRP